MISSKAVSLCAVVGCAVLAACAAPGSAPAAPDGESTTAPTAASEAFSRTIEDGGTGPFKAVLVSDRTLATHTIFRPANLSGFGEVNRLPVIAWGNGGCADSPRPVVNFLSEVASHGFLVIAIGPTSETEPAGRRGPPGGVTRSSQLLDVIDWAIAQNANPASPYHNKIDVSKIAVIGTSCGGLQALEVSPDPRITTTVVANSGILNTPPRTVATAPARPGGLPGMPPLTKDHLARLHAPVLYILGGPSDIATPNGTDDFRRIEKVPAYFASIDVGHGGTFARPHGGAFAPVAVAWFKWQLKGDAEAAKLFTGDPSGLAGVPGWTVLKKNIP